MGDKDCRCLELTTLLFACFDSIKICALYTPVSVWACTGIALHLYEMYGSDFRFSFELTADTVVIKPRIGDCRMGVWGPSGAEILFPPPAHKSQLRVNHPPIENDVLSPSSCDEALCLIKAQTRLHFCRTFRIKATVPEGPRVILPSNFRAEVRKSFDIFLRTPNNRDWMRMTLNHKRCSLAHLKTEAKKCVDSAKVCNFVQYFSYEMLLNMPCYKVKVRSSNFLSLFRHEDL
jgi:hypothetical protein